MIKMVILEQMIIKQFVMEVIIFIQQMVIMEQIILLVQIKGEL